MIWLIFMGLAALGAGSVSQRAERARLDREIEAEKQKLEAEARARAAAAAEAAANKERGEQYLAMKPTVAAVEYADLNGEHPRHL